ncbi:decapping and exoribonuclease protein-like isoform X2 [Anticarsia gemmatalis]|uniref:decapping and exoribonuclease protein-like isoform X2 n=1 Tax=Anticarsia gemmatalis TaxID=129554 RepID=UPI003F76FC20
MMTYHNLNLPDQRPDIEKPVIENEEFSLYFYTTLGQHKLFYGAQIDGMWAAGDTDVRLPETSNLDANLTFLRNNKFIELKTTKELHNIPHVNHFKKYKMLRCWCQCYLANLKGLLVGYRDEKGIVHEVKWFDTPHIANYCKDSWTPQSTLFFLDKFLTYIKENFKTCYGENCDSSAPLTLKFEIDEHHKFSCSRPINNAEDEILPTWFTHDFR